VAVIAIVALVVHRLREIRHETAAAGAHAPGRDQAGDQPRPRSPMS